MLNNTTRLTPEERHQSALRFARDAYKLLESGRTISQLARIVPCSPQTIINHINNPASSTYENMARDMHEFHVLAEQIDPQVVQLNSSGNIKPALKPNSLAAMAKLKQFYSKTP